MRSCLLLSALALLLLVAEAKKAPRQDEAESGSHSSKKYSKDHQKPQHFEHKKEEPQVNEADPRPKQAPLEVPEPEIELQGHLEKSHKVLAEENEKDLHLQDLAYEEKRHRKQEADKKKKSEKKLFAEQEEASVHSVDEQVIEDSFEPLEQQQEKPKKNKKQKEEKRQKEEKKKHKEDKKHNKKAHEKKNKDKQKKNGKKYNKKEHKKY